MSVYAVYGRGFRRSEWSLRDVFATQVEAEQHAAELVRESEEAVWPAGVPEEGWSGCIEAAVVESESRTEVPDHLPTDWIAPVVARFGQRHLAEPYA
jgi:hypothetical protein